MKRASVSFPGGATSIYWLDMKCNPSEVCLSKAFNIGAGGGDEGISTLACCWLFLHLCKWDKDTYFLGRKLCCPSEIDIVMTIFPSLGVSDKFCSLSEAK